MLMYLDTDTPYNPDIYYFLSGFDVYDDDDGSFENELNKYDPNNDGGREFLIKNYIINRYNGLPYKHKFILVNLLDKTLKKSNFDFNYVFEHYADDYSTLPWDWDIKDPRGFFEDIYKIAKESWKNELYKASLEDPNAW